MTSRRRGIPVDCPRPGSRLCQPIKQMMGKYNHYIIFQPAHLIQDIAVQIFFVKSMPFSRYLNSRCHCSEDIHGAIFPSLSWLPSASFPCHYCIQNIFFRPTIAFRIIFSLPLLYSESSFPCHYCIQNHLIPATIAFRIIFSLPLLHSESSLPCH